MTNSCSSITGSLIVVDPYQDSPFVQRISPPFRRDYEGWALEMKLSGSTPTSEPNRNELKGREGEERKVANARLDISSMATGFVGVLTELPTPG